MTRSLGNAHNRGLMQSGGTITASNLIVGENGTYSVHSAASGLNEELEKLRAAIATLPASQAEHKANIEAFHSALESEAKKGHVNPSLWKVTSQGLLEAAKAVGAVAPSILATAGRLAEWFTASSS